MTNNVVILSSFRSLNKTKLHIKTLQQLGCVPVIMTNLDPQTLFKSPYYDPTATYCEVDYSETKELINNVKKYHPIFILTVTDELIPIVTKTEEACDLPLSVSHEGAKILSNKYLLDTLSISIGLSVAKSLIPKCDSDFLNFNQPCLLKATIGSGQFYNFTNTLTGDFFEYRYFSSGHELFKYLNKINQLNFVLSANCELSFQPDRYSKFPVQFILQEYIEPDIEFSCNGSIIEGELNLFSTGQLFKSANCKDENMQLAIVDQIGRAQHHTEHQFYIMGPPNEHHRFTSYFENIIKKLGIRNLLFSGPDIFVSDKNYFYSDFNPRISGQLSEIEDVFILPFLKHFWTQCLKINTKSIPAKPPVLNAFVGVGTPYLKSGQYVYRNKCHSIHFSQNEFYIKKISKSMDSKENTTKLIITSDSQNSVIQLYDQVCNFVDEK